MGYDLPAGGKRLLQGARGYRATVVAGAITYRDGEPTGALPGRLVRGAARDTAAARERSEHDATTTSCTSWSRQLSGGRPTWPTPRRGRCASAPRTRRS